MISTIVQPFNVFTIAIAVITLAPMCIRKKERESKRVRERVCVCERERERENPWPSGAARTCSTELKHVTAPSN